MDRHLSVVANGFRAAGCILGIPSIAAFLFVCWAWYTIQVTPPDPRYTSVQKYGIVGILESGAYGLGEFVVQGVVTPDEWVLFKPTLATGHRAIMGRRIG